MIDIESANSNDNATNPPAAPVLWRFDSKHAAGRKGRKRKALARRRRRNVIAFESRRSNR